MVQRLPNLPHLKLNEQNQVFLDEAIKMISNKQKKVVKRVLICWKNQFEQEHTYAMFWPWFFYCQLEFTNVHYNLINPYNISTRVSKQEQYQNYQS